MGMFGVYENGRAFESAHYLKWSDHGAAEGELVFMAGNPGSTSRLETMAQLQRRRDFSLPLRIAQIKQRIDTVQKYAGRGAEQARQTGNLIFGLQNGLKASNGGYLALTDPKIMAKKQAAEDNFRRLVTAKPEWQADFGRGVEAI